VLENLSSLLEQGLSCPTPDQMCKNIKSLFAEQLQQSNTQRRTNPDRFFLKHVNKRHELVVSEQVGEVAGTLQEDFREN